MTWNNNSVLQWASLALSLISCFIVMAALCPPVRNAWQRIRSGADRWIRTFPVFSSGSTTLNGDEDLRVIIHRWISRRGWVSISNVHFVLWSVLLVCVSVAGMVMVRRGAPVMTRTNLYIVPVKDEMDAWSYWVRDASGKQELITFCHSMGYEPPFDEGETILEIRFRNFGTCWEPLSYRMLRDQQGEVIHDGSGS